MEKINHLKSTIEHHDLVRIGVMGSASLAYDEAVAQKCRSLGRAIAQEAYCLLTGACPGLPHETVLGAKEVDGHTIGISPAASLREHVEVFNSPHLEYDVMIYTGLGLMGRELINIRSSDIIIVVGGRTGTLGEFAIAHEEGKLIGVLQGSGGIADRLDELEPFLGKATGSVILYDADPERLVASLVAKYKQLRDNAAPSSTLLGTSRSGLSPQS